EAVWHYNSLSEPHPYASEGTPMPSGYGNIYPCQEAYVELWKQTSDGYEVVQSSFTNRTGHVIFDPVEMSIYSVVIYADDKTVVRVFGGYNNITHHYPTVSYNWTTGWITIDSDIVLDQIISQPEGD